MNEPYFTAYQSVSKLNMNRPALCSYILVIYEIYELHCPLSWLEARQVGDFFRLTLLSGINWYQTTQY